MKVLQKKLSLLTRIFGTVRTTKKVVRGKQGQETAKRIKDQGFAKKIINVMDNVSPSMSQYAPKEQRAAALKLVLAMQKVIPVKVGERQEAVIEKIIKHKDKLAEGSDFYKALQVFHTIRKT
jgi:hypothetical protein